MVTPSAEIATSPTLLLAWATSSYQIRRTVATPSAEIATSPTLLLASRNAVCTWVSVYKVEGIGQKKTLSVYSVLATRPYGRTC